MKKLTLIFNVDDNQDVTKLTYDNASFMSWTDLATVRDQQQIEIECIKGELKEWKENWGMSEQQRLMIPQAMAEKIELLERQLAEAKDAYDVLEIAYGNLVKTHYETTYDRVQRLETQLAEANEHRHELQTANIGLRKQLAEAKEREDIDSMRLHLFDEEVQCLRKYLAEVRESVQQWIKTAAENQLQRNEFVEAVEQARQEAAMKCLEIVENNYYSEKIEPNRVSIDEIKAEFELEG